MSRRSRKTPLFVGMLVALLIVGIVGALAFRMMTEPYRTVSALPMKDYTSNSLSLNGNRYKIKGEVGGLLHREVTAGRLVAINTKQGPMAVVFPDVLSATNIGRGQRLILVGEVLANGVVKVIEFQKQ